MSSKSVRLTAGETIVRWLVAQRILIDGVEQPLFPGVFAIFGHGNVTCLGHALEQARPELPTWRGQNEQGMGLAAVGFTKARRRRQIMVATSSIGPGATNMVTAAAVALANRLPVLFLAGDTFTGRGPDPVLQQVEHFGAPSVTVNDAFRPVVRYWDRITRPDQLLGSLPQALATMLDPADCGPAFLGLPQDTQAEAFDVPAGFLEPVVHEIARPRADRRQLDEAAAALAGAEAPLIVAGGGVHYSEAEEELARFAATFGIPVVETMAGKGSLTWDHPCATGPVGVTGCAEANRLAARADVVLAVGTRLGDFTTASWTVFGGDGVPLQVGFNRRFDPAHRSVRDAVADGRLGALHLLRITSRDPEPPPLAYVKVSGGLFLDMTIHDFDMARFVTGSEVVDVYAQGAVRITPEIAALGDIDTAVVTLRHGNGCITTIDNSRQAVYGYDQRVEAFGADGMAASENPPAHAGLVRTATGTRLAPLQHFFLERYAESYARQWVAFVDAVRRGTVPEVTGADGRAPLVIGLAAWRSLHGHRPVPLLEIDVRAA